MIGIAIANSIGSASYGGSVVLVPTATAATSIGSTSFTANWNAFSGANYYLLDVSLSSSFSTFVLQDAVAVTNSYNVTGLTSNTTYYYRVRAVTGSDSDAMAFVNRVYTAGGVLSYNEVTATNQLVLDLKSYSIWTKMKAIYPMVGASASACAQNLKSSSFTGTFNGGWTYASTGVKGNGVNNYMTTSFNMLTQQPTGANVGIYVRTPHTGPSSYPVAWDCSVPPIFNYLGGSQWVDSYLGTTSTLIGDSAGYTGFFQRSGSVGIQNRRLNNLNKGTNSVNYTAANTNMLLGIYDNYTNNSETAFFSLGDYITTTEQDNFYTAVQAFQTTLSRQV